MSNLWLWFTTSSIAPVDLLTTLLWFLVFWFLYSFVATLIRRHSQN